jgi:hypothetical protein
MLSNYQLLKEDCNELDLNRIEFYGEILSWRNSGFQNVKFHKSRVAEPLDFKMTNSLRAE